MPQMTNAQARVIDPILTEVARGYNQLNRIGFKLFPRVPVRQRGGRIITFGIEEFKQYTNTRRAPGQNTRRVQFGYAGAPYALEDHSLEGQVPYETESEAAAVPGIDIAQRTVNGVQSIIATRLEIAQATLATTAANYSASNKTTLVGTAQWSDFSGTSDPIKDVEAAKEAIRVKTGRRPTLMTIGAAVLPFLRQHPKIIDRFKYTTTAVPSLADLAAIFGVEEVVVGDAIQATDAGVFSDIWGKFVQLAYTVPASLASQGTPTFGYTYQLEDMPVVEEPYVDRNAKSWIYPVTDVAQAVIAGADSGYLISGAVA